MKHSKLALSSSTPHRESALSLHTFKYGADLPDPCCSLSVVLSQSQLHVEERHAGNHHEEQVWNQESTLSDKKIQLNWLMSIIEMNHLPSLNIQRQL